MARLFFSVLFVVAVHRVVDWCDMDNSLYRPLPHFAQVLRRKVLAVLEKAATKYTNDHGKVLVLFIDGVDLLSKLRGQRVVWCTSALVTLAKILANLIGSCQQ